MDAFMEFFTELSGQDKFWFSAVIVTMLISVSFGTFQLSQMLRDTFFPRATPRTPASNKGSIEPASKKGAKADGSATGTTTGSAPQELRDTRSRGSAKKR